MTTPEEKELEIKKTQLTELEDTLASHELDLITLKTELSTFQRIYFQTVGKLLIEIDEVEAQIAERLAKKNPSIATTEKANISRNQATQSFNDYEKESSPKLPIKDFVATDELKKLFRDAAKKIHPDLAKNEKDRIVREDLMKKLNEAYQDGDMEKIKSILEEYESSPDLIEGKDIGAVLIRMIRNIALVSSRVNQIKDEIQILINTDIYSFRNKLAQGKAQGRDLLQEMVNQLAVQLANLKKQLELI
jgi:hypothetical protein